MARAILLTVAEEERKRYLLRIKRRQLRDTSDPLQLPDVEFVSNFRLTKAGFLQLEEEVGPYLPICRRKTAVSNKLKLLATLSFFASGSYQRTVGASYMCNMSQPTFSKCLHDVINALNTQEFILKYIKFPTTLREREVVMQDFMEQFGFPGIIGCIDGTHVAIIRPNEHEENFFNRKCYHSLNVLIICDANLNIMYLNASFGGSSHDSYVWNACPIKLHLEHLERNRERCWLLGDSGYAQRPWMMTPILGAAGGSPEEHYTNMHCHVRNSVERCIGVLKARWRCLLAHRVLHYDPVTAGKIVNSCAILHNIANLQNAPIPDREFDLDNDYTYQDNRHVRRVEVADSTRDALVQRLWNTRM